MPDASQHASPRGIPDAHQATDEAAQARASGAAGGDRPGDHDEIRIGPGVQEADIGGEVVLSHPQDGSYFALNETGAHLWRRLGTTGVPRGAAIRAAAAAISEIWRIEAPRAEQDLRELLDELARRRLVAVIPRSAP